NGLLKQVHLTSYNSQRTVDILARPVLWQSSLLLLVCPARQLEITSLAKEGNSFHSSFSFLSIRSLIASSGRRLSYNTEYIFSAMGISTPSEWASSTADCVVRTPSATARMPDRISSSWRPC